MKKAWQKTERFDIGGGFFVDIVSDFDGTSAWIWHTDYGIKELMFGVGVIYRNSEYKSFIETVAANVPSYRNAYVYRVMGE